VGVRAGEQQVAGVHNRPVPLQIRGLRQVGDRLGEAPVGAAERPLGVHVGGMDHNPGQRILDVQPVGCVVAFDAITVVKLDDRQASEKELQGIRLLRVQPASGASEADNHRRWSMDFTVRLFIVTLIVCFEVGVWYGVYRLMTASL
jgi:hypothetical protein